MHRFVWDYRTRAGEAAPFAPPGRYTVRLTLDGRTYTQPLTVRRDPRVRATDADLVAQYVLARDIDALHARVAAAVAAATAARAKPGADTARIDALAGPTPSPARTAAARFTLRSYADALDELESAVESADAAPTPDQRTAWSHLRAGTMTTLRAWAKLRPS